MKLLRAPWMLSVMTQKVSSDTRLLYPSSCSHAGQQGSTQLASALPYTPLTPKQGHPTGLHHVPR